MTLWLIGGAIWLVGELWTVLNRRRGDTMTEATETHPALWTGRSALALWLPFHWLIDGTIGAGWVWDLVALALGAATGAATWRHRRGARAACGRSGPRSSSRPRQPHTFRRRTIT